MNEGIQTNSLAHSNNWKEVISANSYVSLYANTNQIHRAPHSPPSEKGVILRQSISPPITEKGNHQPILKPRQSVKGVGLSQSIRPLPSLLKKRVIFSQPIIPSSQRTGWSYMFLFGGGSSCLFFHYDIWSLCPSRRTDPRPVHKPPHSIREGVDP